MTDGPAGERNTGYEFDLIDPGTQHEEAGE